MRKVCDSGPLIHLSLLSLFPLLKNLFNEMFITPEVYSEVAEEGKNRPGDKELREALSEGWLKIEEVEPRDVRQLTGGLEIESLSRADVSVIALASKRKPSMIISDDAQLRLFAQSKGLFVTGTIGVLIRAKSLGLILNVKDQLDKLIALDFYLDPQGKIYEEALQKSGEL